MKIFNNLSEYNNWLLTKGIKMGKEEKEVVYIEKNDKKMLVCATPLAIEPALEQTGLTLIKEWNQLAKEKNAENDYILSEDDIDLISAMRDAAYSCIESYLNVEIVFISTEY